MQENDDLFERLMEEHLAGTITAEDKVMLFSLIRQSDIYKERYDKQARLIALLHVPALEAEKEQHYQHFRKRMQGGMGGKKTIGVSLWLRFAAASVVLMLLSSALSVYLYKYADGNEPEKTFMCEAIVPFGCQTKILLPDSSAVVLNSGSILKYPSDFGNKERIVYLDGEGYFEVAKNKEKAFLVYTGEAQVKVTGTVFNVRSYPDDKEMEVALIEGGVDVSGGDNTITLKPDEMAVFNRETGSLEQFPCEAYKSALWTTGKLSFVNTSFPELLKSIERKYNIKIRILSKNVKDDIFSGTISADMPLQEVFNFIDMDKKYSFENSGSTFVLRDR